MKRKRKKARWLSDKKFNRRNTAERRVLNRQLRGYYVERKGFLAGKMVRNPDAHGAVVFTDDHYHSYTFEPYRKTLFVLSPTPTQPLSEAEQHWIDTLKTQGTPTPDGKPSWRYPPFMSEEQRRRNCG